MNPIRRELLNGLLVLVIASLLSVAFSAFQVSFNAQLWVLILMGIAIAVTGYIFFEITLRVITSAEGRENEWLKRVGNPARLDYTVGRAVVTPAVVDAIRAMKPGSDLTIMAYIGSEGGSETVITEEARKGLFSAVMEQLKRGMIREYKRLLCFDHDILANNLDLKSGILRVGEGPGTISRQQGEHCRQMMETKGCSLYVAPVILKNVVGFFGANTVSMTLETADRHTGVRSSAGIMMFYDPPNGEIIEQFRQIERDAERRMVAVHKVLFPEDAEPTVDLAAR